MSPKTGPALPENFRVFWGIPALPSAVFGESENGAKEGAMRRQMSTKQVMYIRARIK